MKQDLNDLQQHGKLPDDPAAGARVISEETPIVKTVSQLLNEAKDRVLEPIREIELTLGHWKMDSDSGGWARETVTLFGGGTSFGKSSHLIMVADENIKRGKRVLIVSGEDAPGLYAKRLLLRRSRVNAWRFRKHSLNKEEISAITEVALKAEHVPVYFDARGKSAEWIAKRVRRLIKEYSIDLVGFDYLSAFDNEKRHQDKRNSINWTMRLFTDSIKLEGITGIIYSQITPKDGDDGPDKHSMRDSKDIAFGAENVIAGFQPKKPIVKNGTTLVEAGQKCLLLDKAKDGEPGGLYVLPWDRNSACFDYVDDPEQAPIRKAVADLDFHADNETLDLLI